MLNAQSIDNLYMRYGYSLNKNLSNNQVRVYTLNKGVYFGADIVPITKGADIQNALKQLSDSGYACRLKEFTSIKQAEIFLFDSFFHSSQLTERLQNRYKNFTNNLSNILKVPYEYIPASYILENEEFKPEKNIIDSVLDKLVLDGAQLIIIEAAAGYGKTCTSYEIINKVSLNIKSLSPIFTELSRDRRAAIFKHILQDVIVNEFHSLLDEKLVIHEIQSGKIPLIIDGFDELLSKEQDKANTQFEQVETMLSTIGELLSKNAKIIITGRKTAIFSGDSFMNWIDSNPNDFTVNRYLLNPPRVEDWLSPYKVEKIKENDIPIQHISNPVLLAFLRSLSEPNFNSSIATPNKIVDRYFDSILDREQERQQLNIEPTDQLIIFRRLAAAMIEFDITSDSKDWIKELLIDKNFDLLEKVRKSYPISSRPSLDELTNTLSNHALLDRKGNKDNVGFINDFIFGTFIGQILVDSQNHLNQKPSKHMIELSSTAFQFQSQGKRDKLYSKVVKLVSFSPQEKLIIEYLLKDDICSRFSNASFNDFSLSKVTFSNSNQFDTCVFANCTFEDIVFNNKSFHDTSFVNCVFKNCSYINNTTYSSILLINCNDYDCGFIESVERNNNEELNEKEEDDTEFILKKFIDSAKRPKHRKLSIIIKESLNQGRSNTSKKINSLRNENLIKINGDNAFLTEAGIQRVNSFEL